MSLNDLRFDNQFASDLPGDARQDNATREVKNALWSVAVPTPVRAPRVLAHAHEVAALLGLNDADIRSPDFAQVFAGNEVLASMKPIATNYGGHQFGHWAGQLGDGRAISLGEVLNSSDQRLELQLKGAGPTPYSRRADGRAVLRSSIREFLCSEAMHHLGVPSTRALCLIETGESVVRDMFYDGHPAHEPGAIVCRVAPSFIRFGHFELPAARGDSDLLRQLTDFTIQRDFPHITGSSEQKQARWFREVCERTASMVSMWLRFGFVHGVMNTDNMSILGLTIDYGPYGWVDDFDPHWTPNTTDAEGRRYAFGNQAPIAHWNLLRLANALATVMDDHDMLRDGLKAFENKFAIEEQFTAVHKLGLDVYREGDMDLLHDLYALMAESQVDMTIFFRQLAHLDLSAVRQDTDLESIDTRFRLFETRMADAFYDPQKDALAKRHWKDWLARYATRLRSSALLAQFRIERMNAANPKFVLRNYLAQEAIDLAHQGDASRISELLDVLRHPFDEQPGKERFAQRRPEWAKNKAGCSMLSCSS